MNNKDKLLTIINEVLVGTQREKMSKIKDEYNLRLDIGFDSFDLAELTVRIEEVFDIDIFEDGIVETIEQILIKINEK